MSAGSKATMLGARPVNLRSLNWQGWALIRCIVLFDIFFRLIICLYPESNQTRNQKCKREET